MEQPLSSVDYHTNCCFFFFAEEFGKPAKPFFGDRHHGTIRNQKWIALFHLVWVGPPWPQTRSSQSLQAAARWHGVLSDEPPWSIRTGLRETDGHLNRELAEWNLATATERMKHCSSLLSVLQWNSLTTSIQTVFDIAQ